MERATFERRLLQAAARARDFARQFIAERLPDAMLFRVQLNGSYDRNAGPEFTLFPEDSNKALFYATKELTAERVVEVLWRDGRVPQWIDLTVVGETETATVIEALACGRFIADEEALYYTWTDVAPFGVKGPALPIDYKEGRRFSVYTRTACYTLAELERARRSAAKVWSLDLYGPTFDDAVLASRLKFPKLEILELHDSASDGSGLAGLADVPRLTHLRVSLCERGLFDLGMLPRLKSLESLKVTCLSAELAGVGRLAMALPSLRELSLASKQAMRVDAELRLPAVEELTLEFPNVPRWVVIPRTLRQLDLHAPMATDDEVCRVLAECPDGLERVDLRGSPVSVRVLEALERFAGLRSVEASDTQIPNESLWRFAASRHNFRCWPPPPRVTKTDD